MGHISKAVTAMLRASSTTTALASESATYTYDAKGRLTKVVRSGTVNDAVTSDYIYDRADNGANAKVTGSLQPAPSQ